MTRHGIYLCVCVWEREIILLCKATTLSSLHFPWARDSLIKYSYDPSKYEDYIQPSEPRRPQRAQTLFHFCFGPPKNPQIPPSCPPPPPSAYMMSPLCPHYCPSVHAWKKIKREENTDQTGSKWCLYVSFPCRETDVGFFLHFLSVHPSSPVTLGLALSQRTVPSFKKQSSS